MEATRTQAAWGRVFRAAMDAIVGGFPRRETCATAAEMISGLLMEVDTRYCWTLAEALGHPGPAAAPIRAAALWRRARGSAAAWNSWMRWSLFSGAASAVLALTAAATTTASPTGTAHFVPLTCPELVRFLRAFVLTPPVRDAKHILHWTVWRRRHQTSRSHDQNNSCRFRRRPPGSGRGTRESERRVRRQQCTAPQTSSGIRFSRGLTGPSIGRSRRTGAAPNFHAPKVTAGVWGLS